MLRVLMTGSADPYALEPSYEKGLSSLSLELRSLVLSSPEQRGWRKLYSRVLRRTAQRLFFRDSNIRLRQQAAAFQPNVIWVFKGMEIYPSTLRAFRRQGVTLVNYNPDHPFEFFSRGSGNSFIRDSIPEYHLHITYSRRIARELRDRYPGIRVVVIPFGHDVSEHLFARISDEGEVLKACFVGVADDQRRRHILDLTEAGIETDVYGPGWERFLRPSEKLRIYGAVRGEEMLRTLRRYRVQLNFFRPHNRESHNMRSFEVPAAGGIMLAPDSIEHRAFFVNGGEAFFFNSTTEMIRLTNHLLSMPQNEAQSIRMAARRRSVTSGYSYRERAILAVESIETVVQARQRENLTYTRGARD